MSNQVVNLLEENNRLRIEFYGSKAEAHHVGEVIHPKGSLFNEAEDLTARVEEEDEKNGDGAKAKPAKKSTRSSDSGGRNPFPPDLPRNAIVCDLPEEEKICPNDGAALVKINERVVETIAIEPAKISINQYVYPVYRCLECKKHVAEQPVEPTAIPQASCDASLLAYILAQKYRWGLPLYRIEAIFSELGIEITRASLSRWVIAAADLLGDVAFEIRKYILAQQAAPRNKGTTDSHKSEIAWSLKLLLIVWKFGTATEGEVRDTLLLEKNSMPSQSKWESHMG